MNTSSHHQLTHTILRRIRSMGRPLASTTAFVEAEQALRKAGIGFSVIEAAASERLASAA